MKYTHDSIGGQGNSINGLIPKNFNGGSIENSVPGCIESSVGWCGKEVSNSIDQVVIWFEEQQYIFFSRTCLSGIILSHLEN